MWKMSNVLKYRMSKIQVIFTRYGVLRERKEALIELDRDR